MLQDIENSQVFFRADRCFNFIVTKAENVAWYKYVVQNNRRLVRNISGIIGGSVPIPNQNSFNTFFLDSSEQFRQHLFVCLFVETWSLYHPLKLAM